MNLPPEARARLEIDQQLTEAGWVGSIRSTWLQAAGDESRWYEAILGTP